MKMQPPISAPRLGSRASTLTWARPGRTLRSFALFLVTAAPICAAWKA
jgi:hypothetical protein